MRQWIESMGRCVVLICVASVPCGAMGDVAAGELRKCVLPNGRHAYASDACPSGSREVWRQVVAADPKHDAALKRRLDEIGQWQQASRREAAMRLRPVSVRGGARVDSAATRCERARQKRDRIRDKEWMRMTYDRMIQLDDMVADACR